jgi:carbonic anhydrase/acetyltransferase-like protein (isoleucine patch superfamily)
MILSLNSHQPRIDATSFVADSADIIGDVTLSAHTSVWFQAVLRGDNDAIEIGEGSNIQDGVIIHVDPGRPCRVGKRCVIGHRAVLHGCTLGNEVLIGIGAIVLNGAHVPDGCLVGAGALVSENKILEPGHLYMGVPARKIRALDDAERAGIIRNTEGYQARAKLYKSQA